MKLERQNLNYSWTTAILWFVKGQKVDRNGAESVRVESESVNYPLDRGVNKKYLILIVVWAI